MAAAQRRPRRVFLSHTAELRQFPLGWSFVAAAESAVTRAGDSVAEMAYFPAADRSPDRVSREAVRAADVFVLIAGFRYGSSAAGRVDRSFVELEFEAASAAGIPRLVFLIGADTEGPADLFIDHRFGERQQAFRARLQSSGFVVATVTTPDRLETEVLHALSALRPRRYRTHPRPGASPPADAAVKVAIPSWDVAAGSAEAPAKPTVDLSYAANSLELRLGAYYGRHSCVVDGPARGEIDWVALDRDVGNLSFSNLVPLGRRHRLRPAGHRSWQFGVPAADYRFSLDLTAENLLLQARRHFQLGSPPLAFGCARLGECLSMRAAEDFEAEPDDGWAFLTQCMFYLPYRMDIELLEALLRRVGAWLRFSPCCPRNRQTSLLLSVANLYQDIGDWERADDLYGEVLRCELAPMAKAAVVRRKIIGGYFRSGDGRSAVEAFREVEAMRTPLDFNLSVAIAKGWRAIEGDEPGQALRFLEPFDFTEDALGVASDFSPHNSLELKLTQASALSALGMNYESQAQVVSRIVQMMQDTRLRPVFTDRIAPVILTPHLNELITPLRSRMLATPALLRAMSETAKELLAAGTGPVIGRPTWVD
jgi:hypothetical protein